MTTKPNKGTKMKTQLKVDIYTLDVWAGEEEGTWDINDWFPKGSVHVDEEADSEATIRLALEKIGAENIDALLETHEVDEVCDTCIKLVRKSDGYPVLELQIRY